MKRLLLAALLLASAARAESPVVHARIDRESTFVALHRDLTFERTVTLDRTLFTRRGLQLLDRATFTFNPAYQTTDVAEAWVDQPDGTRIPVPQSSIFTRPSTATQSAPALVATVTTSVLFPQLREGSRTHVVWHTVQKTPYRLGFSLSYQGYQDLDADLQETIVELPADLPFRWARRGPVDVQDITQGDTRRITARLAPSHARTVEPGQVSPRDFMPLFIGTSLATPEEIGAILARDGAGRAAPTPEIAARAAQIAGSETGEAAARALHAWVTRNIRYTPVALSVDTDHLPRPAGEVLRTGTGDSRDCAALLQALLAARGIAAEPVLVDEGTRFADPILATPATFDHEILYIPALDRYVDPANTNAPFDALARDVSGKYAVHITPGGRVAHTPASTPDRQRYRYDAFLRLRPDGTLEGNAVADMTPATEIGVRRLVVAANAMTALAAQQLGATIEGGAGKYVTSDARNLAAKLFVSGDWVSSLAVNPQGGEIFLGIPQGLDLLPVSLLRGALSDADTRWTPVLAGARDWSWDIVLALPTGAHLARIPRDVAVETAVGTYTAHYQADGTTLRAARRLVVNTDVVQPESYAAFRAVLAAALLDARAIVALSE
jgi:transglutaminase-like putative cysteine protease